MNALPFTYVAETLAVVATLFAGCFYLVDHVPGQRKDIPAKLFVASIIVVTIYIIIY